MHLLISIIDWEYPASKEEIYATEWNLDGRNTLQSLILAYGNGVILELRAEGENEDAIEMLRGVAISIGHSERVELSPEEKHSLWLFQEGDECYRQPMTSGGYTFLNPIPQPDKFHKSS